MQLIQNWRQSWRMYSVQVLGALAVLPLAWDYVPPEMRALIPDGWHPYIIAAVAIGGIAGRLIDQGKS